MSAELTLPFAALLALATSVGIAWPFKYVPRLQWLTGISLDAVLRMVLFALMPLTMSSCFTLLAFMVFSRLAWIDASSGQLPDRLTLFLLAAGLLQAASTGYPNGSAAVLGASVGYLLLYGVDRIWHIVMGHHAIGGGDMKLLAALGAWTGIDCLLLLLSCACLLAAGSGIIIGRHRAPKATLPFGPFLVVSALFQLLLMYHWAPPFHMT